MNAVTKAKTTEVADYSASILEVISKAARDPNVDIDKMERLLQMQERVQARDAEVAFSQAFAAMQCELPAINMRGQIVHNGKVISEYAEWGDVSKAITPILSKHGFSLSFKPAELEKRIAVTATLRHQLGHKEEATLPLPTDTSGAKNAVQAVGSTLTYGKRYTAILILNIRVEGEDDDGSASGPKISHEGPRDMPFPNGPAKNKTELKEMGRKAWQEIESATTQAKLDVLLEKHRDLIEQLKGALPSWWTGGQRDGNSFEGLDAIISRMRADFSATAEWNNP